MIKEGILPIEKKSEILGDVLYHAFEKINERWGFID